MRKVISRGQRVDGRVAFSFHQFFTFYASCFGVNPILLRIETKAGHGAGKPTAKVIEQVSDVYAFLFAVLK